MIISGIQKFTVLDYPDKTACIIFTPGCNFRCGYCHNPEFVLPVEIKKIQHSFFDEEPFFKFLEERKGKLDGVVITGGEPTLQPDLIEFMGRIQEKGFLVKLDSNGARPEILEKAYEAGVLDYVAMDIKTDAENYRQLVGDVGDPEQIKKSIALIMSSGIPYEFRTTIVKELHTPEIIENMAGMISGATHWFGQTFRPGHTLDPKYAAYQPYALSEMEALREIVARHVDNAVIR